MKWMDLAAACLDHALGRGHGGGNRDDRILTGTLWNNALLCYACNQKKGSRRYHWLPQLFYVPVQYTTFAEALTAGAIAKDDVPPWCVDVVLCTGVVAACDITQG